MKKMLLFTIILILASSVAVFPQELMVKTMGVSVGDVAADTLGNPHYLGIKDRVATGLTNVGIESKVYLRAVYADSFLTNVSWSITDMPSGSAAEVTPAAEADSIATFIPDKVGAYTIEVMDGGTSASVVVYAGTFMGDVNNNCSFCHGGKIAEWKGTGHATMLDEGLDGIKSSHYGESCIECHTVGYDLLADNNGFDDFPFLFPDTLYVGMADSMYATYPDAMKRANIQCENCHGPAANDNAAHPHPEPMAVSYDVDVCASCHQDGNHHVFPGQWALSKHASGETLFDASRSGGSCSPCHNGQGFVEDQEGEEQSSTELVKIGCATCHDPHDATNDHQIRTLTATLETGEVITEGGYGILCMNCHRSRRVAEDYVADWLSNLSSHYGAHHGPQAEMLLATNMVTWGEKLPSSPHLQATENACVTCHMSEEGDLATAGMHTFSMVDENGVDNVAACEPCHGTVGESFADKKYYLNGNADHDGNGVAEGLQHEIHGLLDTLAYYLPKEDGEVSINDSSVTYDEAAAGYIYFFVEEDRSLGIHNPAFAVSLVQLAIRKLKDQALSISPMDQMTAPTEYSLSQNYPNPFNPYTQIDFTIKKAGNVSLTVYNMLGQEVSTLINEEMAPGSYKAKFDGTGLASGVYIYRLTTNDYTSIKKMVLMK